MNVDNNERDIVSWLLTMGHNLFEPVPIVCASYLSGAKMGPSASFKNLIQLFISVLL